MGLLFSGTLKNPRRLSYFYLLSTYTQMHNHQHHLSGSLLFLFALFFVACGGTGEKKQNNSSTITETPTETIPEDIPVEKMVPLIVNLDNLRLRADAGEKGKEIGRLPKGTVLQDLGEVSDFTTRVRLRGIWFDEPWLKVRTEQGLEGWVYAGAIRFDVNKPSELTEMLLRKRLQTTFGKELTQRIHTYRKNFRTATTSTAFAENYREGAELQALLNKELESKIVLDDTNQLPDLFWIDETLPALVPALVAEGTAYYLFRDYKALGNKAINTEGKEDDHYVALNYLVHNSDSIEHFFPAWMIQTWDYGGHSLLGQGEHLKILKKVSEVVSKSSLFLEEAMQIKTRLIADMLDSGDVDKSGTGFWEPKEKILKELDAILAAEDITVLSAEDRVALETRRKILENPEQNGIKMNYRSGLVQ